MVIAKSGSGIIWIFDGRGWHSSALSITGLVVGTNGKKAIFIDNLLLISARGKIQ